MLIISIPITLILGLYVIYGLWSDKYLYIKKYTLKGSATTTVSAERLWCAFYPTPDSESLYVRGKIVSAENLKPGSSHFEVKFLIPTGATIEEEYFVEDISEPNYVRFRLRVVHETEQFTKVYMKEILIADLENKRRITEIYHAVNTPWRLAFEHWIDDTFGRDLDVHIEKLEKEDELQLAAVF